VAWVEVAVGKNPLLFFRDSFLMMPPFDNTMPCVVKQLLSLLCAQERPLPSLSFSSSSVFFFSPSLSILYGAPSQTHESVSGQKAMYDVPSLRYPRPAPCPPPFPIARRFFLPHTRNSDSQSIPFRSWQIIFSFRLWSCYLQVSRYFSCCKGFLRRRR